MTQRQTNRSRVLRRVGAAVAATIAVSTVASTAGVSARQTSASKVGGTIKVAMRDTMPGWCTGNNPAGSALMATRTIYDTLFEKTAGGDLVGMLAESATPSSDLKTYTIKIRKMADGSFIKFHDGTNLDADAVAFNINASRGALTAAWLTLATTNPSALPAAVAAGQAIPGHVLGTSVPFQANILSATGSVGGDIVTVKLDRPQNDLTGTMYASGRYFVRSKRQLASWPAIPTQGATNNPMSAGTGNGLGAGKYCGTFPIGTGPFMVNSNYTFNTDQLVVVKNPNYWRKDATGVQLPYLDGIQFDNIKDGVKASQALQTGGYSVGQFSGATDGTFIKNLRKKKSILKEFKTPYEYYPSIWMNQKVEPAFQKKSCRDAISYGLDRKTYALKRGGNEQRPAKSLVGPTSVMYTTSGFKQFSLTKAKAALKKCKTEAGISTLEITIPADRSNASLQNSKEIQSQLKRVGIKVNIDQDDSTNIINKAFNASTKNQYDMINILLLEGTDVSFNLPFLVTNSFANNFSTNPIKALYGASGAVKLGDILNLSLHTDEKIDAALYAAQAVPPLSNGQINKKKVGPMYKKVTRYIQTNSIMSSLTHQYVSIFARKNIGGIGTLKTPNGKTPRVVTNWGIQYPGVYIIK
ncbi:MAG: ABC transporter substrate-binding protein [Ilumatobacteraceae bacterium]